MSTPIQIQQLPRPQSSNLEVTRKKLADFSYGLNDLIGSGYSSQVFRGTNDLTGTHGFEQGNTVAVKVIDLRKLTDKVLQDMLMSEIASLRLLRGCRHIIQLEEVFSTKNNIYIITELCEDGDLTRIINDSPHRSEERSAALMEQLLQGYLDICRAKVVHRDIKPANIFMQGNLVKIADFGFSVPAEQVREPCSYNVGSPMYMAPEVLLRNHYSYKSDIWALGIIYYELLFGCRPWTAKDEKELAERIRLSPLSAVLPSAVSRTSMAFLQGALCYDVNRRISPEELSRFTNMAHLNTEKQQPEKVRLQIRSNISNVAMISFKENSRSISMNNLSMLYNPVRRVRAVGPLNIERVSANTSIVHAKREPVIVRRDNSRILMGELHFCRFLFKVASRLKEFDRLPTKKLIDQLMGLVMHKLALLQNCQKANVFGLDGFEEYRNSCDFHRIIGCTRQYQAKYVDELGPVDSSWVLNYTGALEALKDFVRELHQFIRCHHYDQQTGDLYQCHLWLLDRLVTTCQLLRMAANSSAEQFSRSSNIESIVDAQADKALDLRLVEQSMRLLPLD